LETQQAKTDSAQIALVTRAADGDAEAFGQLVRAYQRRVVSIAYRLLGNAEDASDVSQDAFVRAFKNLDQLADASRFGPWLLRIVSNLSLNYRRSRATRAATSLDDGVEAVAEIRNPTTGLKLVTDGGDGGELPADLQAAIGQAMEQLPEQQRLTLILFSVEGVPQKEVAEILDCTVELVKWNVFQARKKLKGLLAEYV
jgi:RNA polymerase sigma-70 factor, ECF subfamily